MDRDVSCVDQSGFAWSRRHARPARVARHTWRGSEPIMSGPIVRKYGFPNFEKFFGPRALEHGVDEGEPPPVETQGVQPGASGGVGAPAAKKPGDAGAQPPGAARK